MRTGTRRIAAAFTLLWLAAIVSACGSDPTATPTPTSPPADTAPPAPTAPPEPTNTPTEAELFEQEWAELIAEAQAEGRVETAFTSGAGTTFAHLLDIFKAEFGIDYTLTPGRGRNIQDRIEAEQAAGRFTMDVWGSGQTSHAHLPTVGAMSPFEEWLIHPDVKDVSLWKDGIFRWADEEQKYSIIYATNLNSVSFMVNSDLIPNYTEIKTHEDILNPEWRGKIVLGTDPVLGDASASDIAIYYPTEEGKEWLTRLYTEMDPVIQPNVKLRQDGIARGTYVMGSGADPAAVAVMKDLGLPVGGVILRDFGNWRIGSAGIMSVMTNPPHPAASKLLVNWLLSDEGWDARVQTTIDYPDLTTSYREAVPLNLGRSVDHLPSDFRLPDRELYIAQADPDFLALIEEGREWFRQMGREAGF